MIALANEPEQLKRFFDRLQNPMWLAPLDKRGLFDSPPEPISHGWEGTRSSPIWPQSGYLARMAPEISGQVLPIVRRLIGTQNLSVRADLVDAAISLPASAAAQLVPSMVKWLNDGAQPGMHMDIARRLGKLMVSLGRQGETEPAIRLCKALLFVERLTPPDSVSGGRVRLRPEAEARIDRWAYRSILREDVPELALGGARETLLAVIGCLSATLHIRRGEGVAKEAPDYSSIWRPAIEPHAQNDPNDRDIANLLISGLRDLVDHLVGSRTMSLEDVVSILRQQDRPVFQRIALYALGRYGASAHELVVQWLTDRTLFD